MDNSIENQIPLTSGWGQDVSEWKCVLLKMICMKFFLKFIVYEVWISISKSYPYEYFLCIQDNIRDVWIDFDHLL